MFSHKKIYVKCNKSDSKDTYCMIPLICSMWNRGRKQTRIYHGLKDGRNEEFLLKFFRDDKKFGNIWW